MKPYYDDGQAVIYHGDCREILPELPRASLIATDPPYGVGKAEWDSAVPDLLWLELARASANVVAFTSGVTHLFAYPQPDWLICWARPASVQRNGLGGFNNWEPILVYGKPKLGVDLLVLSHTGNESWINHPCPKPLKLMTWLIESLSETGPVVDPFMGSGTTLRAAKDLGRPSIGIDVEERYCEIAAKRLQQEVLPLGNTA